MSQIEASPNHDIDLRTIFRELWRGKRIIVASAVLSFLAAVVYSLLAPEIYRAEALVQPRQASSIAGPLGAVATQLGGLADLAGLTASDSGDRAVALATLTSRTIIESFIEDHRLLPKLFPESWDAGSQAWESTDPRKIPTNWQAYTLFVTDILGVSEQKRTGLVVVSVEWRDPHEAQAWVSELITRTNDHLKAKAIQEAERNLAYLDEQSKKIGQVELQRALYNLVETEMKKMMIAKGAEEFAIRTIDKAVVPQRRLRPKRTLIAAIGLVLGATAGVLTVLMRIRNHHS